MKSLRESLLFEANDLRKKYDLLNKKINDKPNQMVEIDTEAKDRDGYDFNKWTFNDVPAEIFALANYLGSKAKSFKVSGYGEWGDGECKIEVSYKNKDITFEFSWGSETTYVYISENGKITTSVDEYDYDHFMCPIDTDTAIYQGGLYYNVGMLVDMWKKYIE